MIMVNESLKLLIVDDDDVDRERIHRMLNSADVGATIDERSNISDSLTLLDNYDYDCVIVDYKLGIENGFTLLDSIRNSAANCAVIMVTGLGDEDIAAEALRLGASDYLVKNQLKAPKLFKAVLEAIHKNDTEKKLHQLAHFDELTGLVTRRLLVDRLQQEIVHAGRSNNISAVAFIDLDNFKPVNDNYGHEAGDEVLVETSLRLKNTLRCTDTIARIGGDEFVLILSDVSNPSECEDLLVRILLIINVPIMLSCNSSVRISASLGVSIISNSNIDADTVLRRADQTMYQAKNSGKNKILFFDPDEENKQKIRREMLSQAEAGIVNDEFTLNYQPKVNMMTGECTGVEALIRWNHPSRGLLQPISFEEALHHSTIGIKIGEWVIATAIHQHCLWAELGLDLKISVNISPSHFQYLDFYQSLDSVLTENSYSSTSQYLEFEILESASMENIDVAIQVLNQCRARGISTSLDDFGTGYASLKYLKLLPIDTIKIDRSFVENIESDTGDIAIVKSIVGLCSAFNYDVIAEGIEKKSQAEKLVELGCHVIQGYYLAKPMAGGEIFEWVRNYKNTL
jgi:diguanylate cyclase (GGDEF)-like protein